MDRVAARGPKQERSASSPRATAAGNQRHQAVPCSLPPRAALSKSLISLASPSLSLFIGNECDMPWPPAEASSLPGSSSSGPGLGSDVSNLLAALLVRAKTSPLLHLKASPSLPDFVGEQHYRPASPEAAVPCPSRAAERAHPVAGSSLFSAPLPLACGRNGRRLARWHRHPVLWWSTKKKAWSLVLFK